MLYRTSQCLLYRLVKCLLGGNEPNLFCFNVCILIVHFVLMRINTGFLTCRYFLWSAPPLFINISKWARPDCDM